MSIQISNQGFGAINNRLHEMEQGPRKPVEKQVPKTNEKIEDRANFSHSAVNKAKISDTLKLNEDSIMAKLDDMGKAEALASAHQPISYERVMQLLE